MQRLKKVGTTTAPLRVSHLDGESVLIHGLLMLVADSFTASLPIRKSGLNFASLQPRLFSACRITELIPCWTLAANFCQDGGNRKKNVFFCSMRNLIVKTEAVQSRMGILPDIGAASSAQRSKTQRMAGISRPTCRVYGSVQYIFTPLLFILVPAHEQNHRNEANVSCSALFVP